MSLCERIAKETDHKAFTELTLELSYLLERNGDALRTAERPAKEDENSD